MLGSFLSYSPLSEITLNSFNVLSSTPPPSNDLTVYSGAIFTAQPSSRVWCSL